MGSKRKARSNTGRVAVGEVGDVPDGDKRVLDSTDGLAALTGGGSSTDVARTPSDEAEEGDKIADLISKVSGLTAATLSRALKVASENESDRAPATATTGSAPAGEVPSSDMSAAPLKFV